MGGGTVLACLGSVPPPGLSPRGRGNRLRVGHEARTAGSIPAWAGEPVPGRLQTPAVAVYPRVGGGTHRYQGLDGGRMGLSPRGRGNLLRRQGTPTANRSIPAWAGEPSSPGYWRAPDTVYPRVGGGTRARRQWGQPAMGLSPRGRGNRQLAARFHFIHRSIPAWAGEPRR